MLGICAAISGCSRRVNVSWPILPRNLADRLRSEKLGSIWLVSWVPTRWHPDRDEHAISLHDFISQNLPRMQVISKRPAQVYGFDFFFFFHPAEVEPSSVKHPLRDCSQRIQLWFVFYHVSSSVPLSQGPVNVSAWLQSQTTKTST